MGHSHVARADAACRAGWDEIIRLKERLESSATFGSGHYQVGTHVVTDGCHIVTFAVSRAREPRLRCGKQQIDKGWLCAQLL